MTRSIGATRRLTAAQRHASEWQLIEQQSDSSGTGGLVATGPWSRPLTRELHPAVPGGGGGSGGIVEKRASALDEISKRSRETA